MKPQIDWEKLSIEDAQLLADELCTEFCLIANCFGLEEQADVLSLTVASHYDDNFHSKFSKSACE